MTIIQHKKKKKKIREIKVEKRGTGHKKKKSYICVVHGRRSIWARAT